MARDKTITTTTITVLRFPRRGLKSAIPPYTTTHSGAGEKETQHINVVGTNAKMKWL